MGTCARACASLLLMLGGVAFAAADCRDATVEMSDGRSLDGQLSIVDNRFYLQNEAQHRKYPIEIRELQQIETQVEKERMEKKWIFKEDGRDEKLYTGETYPVRNLITCVTFHDGHTLEGHVISQTGVIRHDDQTERIWIRAKLEGEVGGNLDDLVHVKRITFKGAGGGLLGAITGTIKLPQGENLLRVVSVHCQNDFSTEARVTAGNKFNFTDCTAGTYDLVVVTDKTVYAGFGIEKAEDAARFDAAQLKELSDWAREVRDYFQTHDPLYGAGNARRAYVLIRMERHGDTSLKGLESHRRYEVWLVHKPADEWQIQKRFYVTRQISDWKDLPQERLVIRTELAGHVLDAAHSNLTVALDLGE